MKKLVMAAVLACAFAAAAAPAKQKANGERETRIWLPIGLSIIAPPMQLPSPGHTVFGAMLNLGYGQMENVAILDVGIVNNVTGSMTGLELGGVNIAGDCFGVQAGAVNVASKTVGLQLGAVNFTGDLHGVQLGLLNMSSSGGAWIFPIFNLGF